MSDLKDEVYKFKVGDFITNKHSNTMVIIMAYNKCYDIEEFYPEKSKLWFGQPSRLIDNEYYLDRKYIFEKEMKEILAEPAICDGIINET